MINKREEEIKNKILKLLIDKRRCKMNLFKSSWDKKLEEIKRIMTIYASIVANDQFKENKMLHIELWEIKSEILTQFEKDKILFEEIYNKVKDIDSLNSDDSTRILIIQKMIGMYKEKTEEAFKIFSRSIVTTVEDLLSVYEEMVEMDKIEGII